MLNGSGINNVERAVISIPLLKVTSSHICIGFWYHMLGPSVSTLDLLLEIVWELISMASLLSLRSFWPIISCCYSRNHLKM